MRIVNNLNDLTVDDQYFMDTTVNQNQASVPVNAIGVVGTASRGAFGQPIVASSYQEFVKKCGDVDTAFSLSGPITVRNIFAQGPATVYFARAQASTSAAAAATVDLNDSQATPELVMTLTAKTPGTWGNGLVAVVADATKTGAFKLTLQYGSETEVWDNLVIAQPATPISGATLAADTLAASNLVDVTFPVTPNTSNPNNGTFALVGGTNGTAGIADTDYTGSTTAVGIDKAGLNVLDNAPVSFVLCAEQTSPTVNSAVIDNAKSITQNGGTPRVGIIAFPASTKPGDLAALTATMDEERGFPCYAWQQIYDNVSGLKKLASPLGFFAGLLAQLNPWESTGNKPVQGTLGVDSTLNLGPGDLKTIAQARVNVVGVPIPAGNPFGVRGGFTLSATPGDTQQIYVRRMRDYIDSQVYARAGVYVDQPITDALMRQVKQTVDDVLYPLKNPLLPKDQGLKDYQIVCNTSNNPDAQQASGMLICDYAVKLLGMNRFMVFRTQIGTGVVITSTQQGA